MSPLIAESGRMAGWHISAIEGAEAQVAVAVHRSMKHSFRAQDTPNADAELTHSTSISARTAWRGHGRIQVEAAGELPQGCCPGGRVPDNGQSRGHARQAESEQDAYFRDSLEWLKQRHGAENVVYAGIHWGRDDTTHVRLCGAA